MEELKPCPFCGSEAETHETTDGWIVSCSSDQNVLDGFTHRAHGYGSTEAEAIAEWNKRAERTCRNVDEYADVGFFICGACGFGSNGIELTPNYCPNCGARVIAP